MHDKKRDNLTSVNLTVAERKNTQSMHLKQLSNTEKPL